MFVTVGGTTACILIVRKAMVLTHESKFLIVYYAVSVLLSVLFTGPSLSTIDHVCTAYCSTSSFRMENASPCHTRASLLTHISSMELHRRGLRATENGSTSSYLARVQSDVPLTFSTRLPMPSSRAWREPREQTQITTNSHNQPVWRPNNF